MYIYLSGDTERGLWQRFGYDYLLLNECCDAKAMINCANELSNYDIIEHQHDLLYFFNVICNSLDKNLTFDEGTLVMVYEIMDDMHDLSSKVERINPMRILS